MIASFFHVFPSSAFVESFLDNANIVAVGNSLTEGIGATAGNSYPTILSGQSPFNTNGSSVQNSGIGGQTTLQIISDFENQIGQYYDPQKANNICLLWEGRNHLVLNNPTVAVAYNKLVELAQMIKAKGFNKIIIATVTPSWFVNYQGDISVAGYNQLDTDRIALNELIKGNTSDWDLVCDLGGKPDIGILGQNEQAGYVFSSTRPSVSDNGLYVDGTHFTDAGYEVVASYWKEALELLINEEVTVPDTTAPVITLTGGNVTIDEGIPYSDPGFSASDDVDGDITANVVVDYGGLDINDPVEGAYTVTYNVSDAAGNPATQKSRTVTVEAVVIPDNPPSTPDNITISSILETSAALDWADATDDNGVSGYNVYLNSVKKNTSLIAVSNYSLTGLTAGTAYDVTVEAVDTIGQTAVSAVTQFTTAGTAPTLQRLSYEGFDTARKHLFAQIYLCPAYLANPSDASIQTIIDTPGVGSNGTDDISKLITEDGWSQRVHEGNDYDYNVITLQQTSGTYTAEDFDEIMLFAKSKIPTVEIAAANVSGWSNGHLAVTALKYRSDKVRTAILFDPAYDNIGPATADQALINGSYVFMFSDAQSGYVGGMDSMWNAFQASVYFDPAKHKYVKFDTGNHNVRHKVIDGTGGAADTTDGRSAYPGDPAYLVHDMITRG